jgi:G:T-mismatch repair DNA endonuclease (very short patch repair protein)
VIYYTGKHGNKRFVRFEDGRVKIPDFKVKGQPRVIEIYRNYWHGEEFCKKNKLPDYNYRPERLVEEYAKKDIECRVYWEAEIRDIRKIAEIIQEIRGWLKTPALYSGKKLLAVAA